MLADLSKDEPDHLKGALGQIGNILYSLNILLPEDYKIVAGSIFYNDPSVADEFQSLSIVLPADASFVKADDPSVEIATDVPIYGRAILLGSRPCCVITSQLDVLRESAMNQEERCKRRSLGAGRGYELRCEKAKGCPD